MSNPEHTSNRESHRQDPMHPHGVAGTPGNPGPAKGGTERLNETEPNPVGREQTSAPTSPTEHRRQNCPSQE